MVWVLPGISQERSLQFKVSRIDICNGPGDANTMLGPRLRESTRHSHLLRITIIEFDTVATHKVWLLWLCGARDHDEQRKEAGGSLKQYCFITHLYIYICVCVHLSIQ